MSSDQWPGSIPGIAGLNAAQKWFADLGRARPGAAPDADYATACGHALAHIESVCDRAN